MNIRGWMHGIIKAVTIFMLWLGSSALTALAVLASIYGAMQMSHPTDPSIGDTLAWMILFGAPLWGLIGITGGTIITVLFVALVTRNGEQRAEV